MQDRSKEAIMKLHKNNQMVEKAVESLTTEKPVRVSYPPYWRKRKLNPKFIEVLEETAKSDPVLIDEHGEYKAGTFLYGPAIVIVSIQDDLWALEIHSEHPIGLPMIQEIRYKYIPDSFLMAKLFPSREENKKHNAIVLYQIPGSMNGNNEKENES